MQFERFKSVVQAENRDGRSKVMSRVRTQCSARQARESERKRNRIFCYMALFRTQCSDTRRLILRFVWFFWKSPGNSYSWSDLGPRCNILSLSVLKDAKTIQVR
jgi:hypothetical protein